MKNMKQLLLASLAGSVITGHAAVTHTIINKSDHDIHGWIAYRGKSNFVFKSCRPDSAPIKPGKSLVSQAGGCLLKFVQIQDYKNTKIEDPFKIIKLSIANASANIAKTVGIGIAIGLILLAAATDRNSTPLYYFPLANGGIPNPSTVQELVVYAATSTVWEYDGVSLKPISGVRGYGIHDFTKSH
jgi:hypothetical protein